MTASMYYQPSEHQQRIDLASLSVGLSIVVPVYSRSAVLPVLVERLLPLAVLPVTWAIGSISRKKRVLASACLLTLFGWACLGFPSRTGYLARQLQSARAWDAVHFYSWGPRSLWLITERNFVAAFAREPGAVLSDIDPVYLNALLPVTFTAAPIDQKHKRRWSPFWKYRSAEADAVVKAGLSQRRPIYALFLSGREIPLAASRLPRIEGYQWTRSRPKHGECVLKLTPLRQESGRRSARGTETAENILLEAFFFAWQEGTWI